MATECRADSAYFYLLILYEVYLIFAGHSARSVTESQNPCYRPSRFRDCARNDCFRVRLPCTANKPVVYNKTMGISQNIGIGHQQKTLQKVTFTQQLAKNLQLLAHTAVQLRSDILQEVKENPALEIKEEPDHESLEAIKNKKNSGDDANKRFEFVESLLVSPKTLIEYLLDQLHLELDNDTHIAIGERIIENLNENGFYKEDPFLLCKDIEGATPDNIKYVLSSIQTFDPIGCATAGIGDSLHIQLQQLDINAEHEKSLHECISLIEHVDAKTEKDIEQKLEKYMNDPELQHYFHAITPYPGLSYNRHYDTRQEAYIVPDAVISLDKDNKVQVAVNNDIIPILDIDPTIEDISHGDDKDAARVANSFIQNARSFITGLQYRSSTLEKITAFIAQHQFSFIVGKQEYPNPLTRKQIAQELQLNESTVSRVISGKYIQTPKGILEMRYFISQSVGKKNISIHKIIHAIENILKQYLDQSLTDNTIKEMLEKENIIIARRTVAKYRKMIETGVQ